MRRPISLDDGKVRVNGDGRDEKRRSQIAVGIEEALDKARRGLDEDAALLDPRDAEKEGRALVHVGNDEVEDEDEKLVGRVVFGLLYALHAPVVSRLVRLPLSREGSILKRKVGNGLGLRNVPREAAGPGLLAKVPADQLDGQVHKESRSEKKGEEGKDGNGNQAAAEARGQRGDVAVLRVVFEILIRRGHDSEFLPALGPAGTGSEE